MPIVSADQLEEMEKQVAASLRRTGVNFIFVWLISIGIVWAAAHYQQHWLLVAASVLVALLFLFVCIPNVGRIAALNKMYGGMLISFRRQLVLADVGAVVVLYPAVALWLQFPLPTLAMVIAAVIAFINSLAGADPA